MDDDEQRDAEHVYEALDGFESERPRSVQKIIGVSELGTCRQKTLLKLLQTDESDHRLKLSAIIGDAVGERAEEAIVKHLADTWPGTTRQQRVTVDLPSGRFQLTGHVDLVTPGWGVRDIKTKDGLDLIRRTGSDQQNRFQRHLYALGASQCGLLDMPVEQAMTGNIYIDRSGGEDHPHVVNEQFDWSVVYDAEAWVEDVVYAAERGEDASRDKPRAWCESWCEYVTTCRGLDTDVTGLIDDPETVSAVELYAEGQAEEASGRKKKDEAKKHLTGISGNTAEFAIRSVHVNETDIPGYTRKAYDKIDIRRK